MEAAKKAKEGREVRIPKFMSYFERVLARPHKNTGIHESNEAGMEIGETRGAKGAEGEEGAGGEEIGWLYGSGLTYVDLALFQVIDGLKFAFPRMMDRMNREQRYPFVFKLWKRVKERDSLSEYFEKRRIPFGDGLFRYYPELDEA